MDLVPTFLGAHAIPPEYKGNRSAYVDLVIEMLPEIRRLGLAEFVDVFCDAGALTVQETERILRAAKDLGFGLKVHSDELEWTGATELACRMGAASCDTCFRCRIGYDMLAEFGQRKKSDTTDSRGIASGDRVVPGKTKGACQVAHGPARCLALGRLQPRNVHGGFHAACMTLACSLLHMTREAFPAATWNAAWASGLGCDGEPGQGFPADAVMFDVADYREVPYRFGWNTVFRVYKKGKEVWSKLLAVED